MQARIQAIENWFPYLGMYLTDLSFIEEGTPDFIPDGLLNFSKMRMV
jgi:hypothetical protein